MQFKLGFIGIAWSVLKHATSQRMLMKKKNSDLTLKNQVFTFSLHYDDFCKIWIWEGKINNLNYLYISEERWISNYN